MEPAGHCLPTQRPPLDYQATGTPGEERRAVVAVRSSESGMMCEEASMPDRGGTGVVDAGSSWAGTEAAGPTGEPVQFGKTATDTKGKHRLGLGAESDKEE